MRDMADLLCRPDFYTVGVCIPCYARLLRVTTFLDNLEIMHVLGQTGSADPLEKWMRNYKAKTCKKSSFLCLCYILRAIRAGRCREWRYADHIFIQIYFRMHHFVVKFSKFSLPVAARPPNPNTADVPVGNVCELTKNHGNVRGKSRLGSLSAAYLWATSVFSRHCRLLLALCHLF